MEIVLFRYRRGNSLMHKVPASLKIIFLMVFCIITFLGGAYNTLNEILSVPVIARTALTFIISIVLFFLSGANFTSLKCLKFVLTLGLVLTLFRMLYFTQASNASAPNILQENIHAENIIMLTNFLGIDLNGVAGGILYTIRFFITTLAAELVFETTSSLQIKESMELIQNAIAKMFPPIKKLNPALVISLAINFIPLIFETWHRVHLAQRARCGGKKNIIQIIQTTFKELEVLLSCLFYKAEIKRLAMLNRQ